MKLSKTVWVATLLFASMSAANATPITWTDDYDPTNFTLSGTHDFTHDIRDGVTGFRPGIDSIFGATLSIFLTDDDLLGDLITDEEVRFRFDGSGWTSDSEVDYSNQFNFSVISYLTDGLLHVWVDASDGDFIFQRSLLTVNGDRATAVPEPATLSLLGLGLFGLAFASRRRQR